MVIDGALATALMRDARSFSLLNWNFHFFLLWRLNVSDRQGRLRAIITDAFKLMLVIGF